MSDLVTVAQFADSIPAEIAKQKLEAAGIPAVVMVDDGGGSEPQFQLVQGVRVLVLRESERRARRALCCVQPESRKAHAETPPVLIGLAALGAVVAIVVTIWLNSVTDGWLATVSPVGVIILAIAIATFASRGSRRHFDLDEDSADELPRDPDSTR